MSLDNINYNDPQVIAYFDAIAKKRVKPKPSPLDFERKLYKQRLEEQEAVKAKLEEQEAKRKAALKAKRVNPHV